MLERRKLSTTGPAGSIRSDLEKSGSWLWRLAWLNFRQTFLRVRVAEEGRLEFRRFGQSWSYALGDVIEVTYFELADPLESEIPCYGVLLGMRDGFVYFADECSSGMMACVEFGKLAGAQPPSDWLRGTVLTYGVQPSGRRREGGHVVGP